MFSGMSEPKYRDKSWLEREYIDKNRSLTDIAEAQGINRHTIGQWVYDKHSIDERNQVDNKNKTYHEKSWLLHRFLLGYSIKEIAKEVGVNQNTILRWKNRHGISSKSIWCRKGWLKTQIQRGLSTPQISSKFDISRDSVRKSMKRNGLYDKYKKRQEEQIEHGKILTRRDTGYELYVCDSQQFRHHRLLAVAKYGFEFIEGKHIHHKSITWDNRLEAIEVLTPSQHNKTEEWPDEREIHEVPRDPNPKFTDREWLQKNILRYNSVEKIAEICDRDTEEIQHWVDWFGIQREEDSLAF